MITYFIAILISLVGLLLHWFKRWFRQQTHGSFISYLSVHPKRTMSSLFTLFGAASMVVASGVDVFSAQGIAMLLMSGYTVDSVINKGNEG